MTSLAWKRKLATNVQSKSAALFKCDSDDVEGELDDDWIHLLPKKKYMLVDSNTGCARLMEEGIFLAEQQRYWEAINRFDDALAYQLNEAKLFEMKAQVLLELNELSPAVEAAEKAVKSNPLWAEAYQTLGRTQISSGNIEMAIRCFCNALHLKPDFEEVYEEDLSWALDLRAKQKRLDTTDTTDEKPTHMECCSQKEVEVEVKKEKYVKLNIMEPS